MVLKTVTNMKRILTERLDELSPDRCRQVGHNNLSFVIRWKNAIAYRTKIGLFKVIGLTTNSVCHQAFENVILITL